MNISYQLMGIMKIDDIPNISSFATASNILDAPMSPDKHAEKTTENNPMMTNGSQMLISGRNK
jgi:hypothetical protein